MTVQVYVIGDVGILEELDLLGFKYIGGPDDGGKDIDLGPGYALPHDPDVSFVLPQLVEAVLSHPKT